jgi:hypothetical protein
MVNSFLLTWIGWECVGQEVGGGGARGGGGEGRHALDGVRRLQRV